MDAYYQDYVGDDTVHFGDGFSQTASDYGGPDSTLDSAEGFVRKVFFFQFRRKKFVYRTSTRFVLLNAYVLFFYFGQSNFSPLLLKLMYVLFRLVAQLL